MASNFARIYVYDILDRAHRLQPRTGIRQYVDDMPQREQEAEESDLIAFFPRAAVSFTRSLQQRKRKLSPKSAFIKNTAEMRGEV